MIPCASISIFDWNGPEFLWFYTAGFCIALIWSLFRRFRANDRFSLPLAAESPLVDPYEIAFLAGGAPRCSQVVLVRLIKSGAIEWLKTKVFRESKLVALGSAEPEFNEIERTVYSSILGYGKSGMPLTSIPQLVATRLSGIESKLAMLGLRPTASETRGRGFSIPLPLIFLLGIGGVKLMVGISRDMPVGFLIAFMIVSLFAAIFVGAGTKKLTPAGEQLLKKMRGGGSASTTGTPDAALCGIALLGVSAMAHDESISGLDSALKRDLATIGSSSSTGCGGNSSSGCSSGGSSGCGGGCGGCGGGGD